MNFSRTPSRSSRNASATTTPISSPKLRKDSIRLTPRSSLSKPTCHVAVRIRPVFDIDIGPSIWTCRDDGRIEMTYDFAEEVGKKRPDVFYFDRAFEGSNNKELYDKSVKGAIRDAMMHGISTTVFAYGQTASGKTYAMMGYEDEPGIIPQAIDDVFQLIRESEKEYLLRVSYMEIYNETIRDLLNPEQKDLRIHENRHRGVYVSPLREEIVTSPKQVLKILQRGEMSRHTSATDYNAYSSRSHTIFQITIEANSKDSNFYTISQLNLIDLAGSERAATDLDRRKEGSFINKSLLTLGTVISKITEEGNMGHVPFRDSKLTRLLQPSLMGDARICVIATVSPTSKNMEETLNTLKFAARVKKILPKPESTLHLDDKALLRKYRMEIEMLKQQLYESQSLLERERSGQSSLTEDERSRYEEQLEESRLLSTSLKERIDHLTKLILTASTITAKPILDWGSRDGLASERRASVMLSSGLLPSTTNLRHSGSMNALSSSARSSFSLDKRLSDQAFMQKHIQEIDKRDTQIQTLTKFLDQLCDTFPMTEHRIVQFMNEHKSIFLTVRDIRHLPDNESAKNSKELDSKSSLSELKKANQEMEIVILDQTDTITMLKNKLDEALDLISFMEQD